MGSNGIRVMVSSEIARLLDENGIDLAVALSKEGQAVERISGVDHADRAADGEKEVVTILIATAAVIGSLTPALTRVVSMVTRRPILVKEWTSVPVENSGGDVVRDAKGQPMLQWVERSKLLEPREVHERSDARVSGPLGISVEIGT